MKILKTIMFFPLVGIIAPYAYIFSSIALLNTFDIYAYDPKTLGMNWFFEITGYIFGIGIFAIPICIVFFAYFLIKRKREKINKLSLYAFILGVVLLIMFYFIDPGSYLNWFFD